MGEKLEFVHKSVLLNETVDSLNVKPDGIYIDGTLGGGGHAYHVCRKLGEHGRFIGIDQDEDALTVAKERLSKFKDVKIDVVKSNYHEIRKVLEDLGVEKVDGILLDIGVSSYQIDTVERGFTYKEDGPLDMRMDKSNPITEKILSMNIQRWSFSGLYEIMVKTSSQRILQNIL